MPVAADRTRVLLGSYRKGDAEDPEIYTKAVIAVLACYPEAVVKRVTDPRGGLPGTSQWLPTVHEVREACEREMAQARNEERRRIERERTDAICGRETPGQSAKRRAEVVAEVIAEVSRKWAYDPKEAKMLDPRALSGPAKQEALARVAEEQRKAIEAFRANPPQFSPELAASIGIRKKDEAA